ncbi:Mediator of RNA polymerase II transcription subunit 4 [Pleosporales sp. CAS-2024a]
MDDLLAAQFDRLEKALSTLVDSIAAYNPSPQAALELVVADDELSQGLDQLSRHQANHARILTLRAEADALEEQKKSYVSALATLRHELHHTPVTTFPAHTRPVRFDELLQYAKNISPYTVPPTYRERAPEPASDKDKDADSSSAPTNGVNTPAAEAEAGETTDNKPVEVTATEEEWLRKLNESQIAWYPWPSHDKIKGGNLWSLMKWEARGKDVATFDVKAADKMEKGGAAPVVEAPSEPVQTQAQGQQPQPQAPRPPRPTQPQATFDMFDDLDD